MQNSSHIHDFASNMDRPKDSDGGRQSKKLKGNINPHVPKGIEQGPDVKDAEVLGDETMEKVAENVGKSLSLPQDVEVLDDETMKKVAVKVGKRFSELAQQLQTKAKRDVADSLDDTTLIDRALWMLGNWKQNFDRLNYVETLWRASLAIGLDLSQELGPLQQNPICPCGNNVSVRFRRYMYVDHSQNDQSLLIGICCIPCGQEWLKDKYLYHPDIENTRPTVELHGVVLTIELEGPREKSPIFQGIGLLPEIGPLDVLKVGDHIAWKRPYILWHHAIVSGVNKNKGPGVIKVIQWNKTTWGSCTKQIVEEEINLADQKGELHRIEYGEEMTNANPTELVIARAKSRIDDNGYSVANDNCETFAFHCKTGVAESSQTKWFYRMVKNVAIEAVGLFTGTSLVKWKFEKAVNAQAGNELMELLNRLSQSSKTGAYIIIAMAGFACIVSLKKFYEQMKQDNLSLKDFAKNVTLRVYAALVGAGLAECMSETVAGAADAWTFKLPGLEIAIGGFIGWFVGDSVSIAVQSAGSFIGPPIGRALARAIGTNDRDVRIVDLNPKPGDQIVVYGKLLHPRHHAIVVSCDQESKKVKVIHSTYEKGIVEEQVDFRDPVYRVIYNDQDCFPSEEVIARAESKIVRGVNEYSLVLNNCKHFAEWCKLKKFNQKPRKS